MSANESYALNREQINRFHDDGYLGPFVRTPVHEMEGMGDRIEREILSTQGPNPALRYHNRHLDCRLAYELIAHPSITEKLAPLLGPDVVCWSSRFWNKAPGDLEIPWHQDINYWPIDPPLNITVWIAIDRVTVENSCVRLIPGSHKKMLPELKVEGKEFAIATDPAAYDASKAVDMVLEPGEFFLFSERLLHQSNANRSAMRRMAMVCRITAPFVKVYHDQPPLFDGHKAMMIRGEDRVGINKMAAPPG